jgi:hypothetical protein
MKRVEMGLGGRKREGKGGGRIEEEEENELQLYAANKIETLTCYIKTLKWDSKNEEKKDGVGGGGWGGDRGVGGREKEG